LQVPDVALFVPRLIGKVFGGLFGGFYRNGQNDRHMAALIGLPTLVATLNLLSFNILGKALAGTQTFVNAFWDSTGVKYLTYLAALIGGQYLVAFFQKGSMQKFSLGKEAGFESVDKMIILDQSGVPETKPRGLMQELRMAGREGHRATLHHLAFRLFSRNPWVTGVVGFFLNSGLVAIAAKLTTSWAQWLNQHGISGHLPEVKFAVLFSLNIVLYRMWKKMPIPLWDHLFNESNRNKLKGLALLIGVGGLAAASRFGLGIGDALGLTQIVHNTPYLFGEILNWWNWALTIPIVEGLLRAKQVRTRRVLFAPKSVLQPFRALKRVVREVPLLLGSPIAIGWGWIFGHTVARWSHLLFGSGTLGYTQAQQEVVAASGASALLFITGLLLGPTIFQALFSRDRSKPRHLTDYSYWGLLRKVGKKFPWAAAAGGTVLALTGLNGMAGLPWFIDLHQWFEAWRFTGLPSSLAGTLFSFSIPLYVASAEAKFGVDYFQWKDVLGLKLLRNFPELEESRIFQKAFERQMLLWKVLEGQAELAALRGSAGDVRAVYDYALERVSGKPNWLGHLEVYERPAIRVQGMISDAVGALPIDPKSERPTISRQQVYELGMKVLLNFAKEKFKE
jgi:hypothetical protein